MLMNPMRCCAVAQGFSKVAKMPYRSDMDRVALTVVFCLHVFHHLPWQAAYDAARCDPVLEKSLPLGAMSKTDQQEARRVRKKFLQEATVKNLPHPKQVNMHKLLSAIPEDEAKMASFLLKSGYVERTPTHHGHYMEEHHYFTSLGQALDKCPALKGIYDKYNALCDDVTPQTFMEGLYKWDPLLRTRLVHIKYALSDDLKAERKHRAETLYNRAQREADFLSRIFFVDECAICFDHEIRKGVHVYCDAHDKGYRFVIPFRKRNPNKKIKVKVMGAVNLVTGPVFMEFTTGTTDIKRLHNKPTDGTQYKYNVSVCRSLLLLAKDNSAPWHVNCVRIGQHAGQHVNIRLHAPSLIHVNRVVGNAEHNTQIGGGTVACGCQVLGAHATLQLQVMHPNHTHACPHGCHTAPHIGV